MILRVKKRKRVSTEVINVQSLKGLAETAPKKNVTALVET